MSTNILQKIVANTRQQVAARKAKLSLDTIRQNVKPSQRSLAKSLIAKKPGYILECKKASPSKGLIRETFALDDILADYQKYASAISVLTDATWFQGDFRYLKQAADTTNLPILCKDFFVEAYQVYEARYHGADAILLMLSVLDDDTYRVLSDLARSLSLDVLTEVHDETELNRAISLNAKIIGINNRDLRDLSIDLATTERLATCIPNDRIIISESGIEDHQDVARLSDKVDGFLIGSSLMAQQALDDACRKLIFGMNKVCGLTSRDDALLAVRAGAIYGGLIFAENSPRKVDINLADSMTTAVNQLQWVAVFQNQSLDDIQSVLNRLTLKAIQLHGDEDPLFIDQLRKILSDLKLSDIEIWKAIAISDASDIEHGINMYENIADRLLFDTRSNSQSGGTGQTFDWSLLSGLDLSRHILAGGLNPENVSAAKSLGFYALDFNSGAESSAGKKSEKKLQQLFNHLRL